VACNDQEEEEDVIGYLLYDHGGTIGRGEARRDREERTKIKTIIF